MKTLLRREEQNLAVAAANQEETSSDHEMGETPDSDVEVAASNKEEQPKPVTARAPLVAAAAKTVRSSPATKNAARPAPRTAVPVRKRWRPRRLRVAGRLASAASPGRDTIAQDAAAILSSMVSKFAGTPDPLGMAVVLATAVQEKARAARIPGETLSSSAGPLSLEDRDH